MFEVEKKFKLNKEEIISLTKDAEFLGEKIVDDYYYDTSEFSLTKNDIWLRKRGEGWELKVPKHGDTFGSVQFYQEIVGEDKIRDVFSVAPKKDFLSDIKEFGYEEFCNLKTTRRKYKNGDFTIDIDNVTSDYFEYDLVEIEIMVEDEEEMKDAEKKIEEFAFGKGLKSEYVRGKVIEYLRNKKPDHYQALVEAGVVRR